MRDLIVRRISVIGGIIIGKNQKRRINMGERDPRFGQITLQSKHLRCKLLTLSLKTVYDLRCHASF